MAGPPRTARWDFILTANGWLATDDVAAALDNGLPIQYYVLGLETAPTTGTVHVQGYVEFKRKKTPKNGYTKARLQREYPGWHWEPRMATQERAIQYIKGPGPMECWDGHIKNDFDPHPLESGTPWQSNQGDRTDIESIIECIRQGMSLNDIADKFPEHWMRMSRGIESLHHRIHIVPKLEEPPQITVVVGRSGCGKSHFVEQLIGDRPYYVPVPPNQRRGASWWDGYNGADVLWLRDFKGYRSGIGLSFFLNLGDKWPIGVQPKGSVFTFRPHYIFICSNFMPGRWWMDAQDQKGAIIRRITHLWIEDQAQTAAGHPYQFMEAHLPEYAQANFDRAYDQ